jgi:hypothetical protein
MILHAVSMIAVLVDQAQQAKCVVQCVPTEPESWVKWLLPTIVQTIVSLASITAGVLIAIWSFRKNRQSEHEQWERNQRAGHEQWVRDQKKAEWSALLRSIADVFHITNFTTLNGWNGKIANRIATELEQALEEISIACANCIFLDNFRLNYEGDKKIEEFIKETQLQAQILKGNLGLFESIADRVNKKGTVTDNDSKSLDRNIEIVSGQISKLAKQSRTLLDWLQNEAALDLGVTPKGEKHQSAR